MKLYFTTVALFAFTFFTLGILLPFLVSAESTIAVWAGIAFAFLVYIPSMYYLTKAALKMLHSKNEKEENEK